MTVQVPLSLKLEGFEQLGKKFDTLEIKLRRKFLRQGLRAGAKIIMRQARSNAPVGKRGRLKRFWKIRSLKRKVGRIGVYITVGGSDELQIKRTKSPGFYPLSVEYGTKNRGIPPNPFFRKAFKSKHKEATRAIGKKIGRSLAKLAAAR